MNLIFNHIRISNFMSIGDSELDLSESGYTLVKGNNLSSEDFAVSNGSGKSSIWEAISWVLTGETIRGCKNVTNTFGTDGALVELTFTSDGNEYIITRTKDHSKLKCSLKIMIDGVDKSGKGIRDSEKLLSQYLPDLTPALIGSVIILGQGLPQKFTSNTPSGRKEVLEKLSQSDFMIEDMKKRVSERLNTLNSELRKVEDILTSLNAQKGVLNSTLISEQEKLNNVDSEQQLLDNIKNIKNAIKDATLELEEAEKKSQLKSEELSAKHDCISELLEKHVQREKEIQYNFTVNSDDVYKYKITLLSQISAKKSEISKKESVVDVCPTCGQKLIGVEKPDTTEDNRMLRELQLKYAQVEEDYNVLVKNRDEALASEQNIYNTVAEKEKSKLSVLTNENRACGANVADIKHAIESLNVSMVKYNSQLDFLRNSVNNIKSNISNLTVQIEKITSDILYNNTEKEKIDKHIAVLNKMNSFIKREFRGCLLSNVIEFLDAKSKIYCKDVFEHSNISFALDGNNVSITFNTKEYEQLSGGEKQKVDVIIQLAIRDMLCKYMNFSSNIFVFDEIFDNIDEVGSEKILNLLSTRLNDVSSIYIVTHHSSIQIPVDREITVVKDATGISRIES